MKKIFLTALLFAGLATAGFSQEKHQGIKRTPEERAQHMTDALSQKLSLNNQQRDEIYKINLDRARDMEKFRADKGKSNKKDFENGRKKFEASDKKILAVLSPDQRKTYEQFKAERKDKMKQHKGDFRKHNDQKGDAR